MLESVEAGNVTRDRSVLVEILPGNWFTTVEVTAGRVLVEKTVVAGREVVTVERVPDRVRVLVTI